MGGSLQVRNPAQERSQVCYIPDVPNLLCGVPAGTQRLCSVLLSEGDFQIYSHGGNYPCWRGMEIAGELLATIGSEVQEQVGYVSQSVMLIHPSPL